MISVLSPARELWRAPARTALTASAAALGAALVASTLLLVGSLEVSATDTAALGLSPDLVVRATADGGIPDGTVADLAALKGVEASASLVQSQARIDGEPALLLGVKPDLATFAPDAARTLAPDVARALASGEVVLTDRTASGVDARPGTVVRVAVGASPATEVTAGAVAAAGPLANVNDGRVALLPAAEANRLLGRTDRSDIVLVDIASGSSATAVADRIDELVGAAGVVASPADLGRQATEATRSITDLLLLTALLSCVIAALLVQATVVIMTAERGTEIAVLRVLGARPRQLYRRLLTEVAGSATVAAAVGAALAVPLTAFFLDRLPSIVSSSLGTEVRLAVGPVPLVAAVVVVVAATSAAAVLPVRDAVRARPVDVLRDRPVDDRNGARPRRLPVVAAAVAVAAAVGAVVIDVPIVEIATPLLILGAAVALVAAGRDPAAQLVGATCERLSRLGILTRSSMVGAGPRLWGTLASMVLAVALAVTVGGLRDNLESSADRSLASLADVDLQVGVSSGADIDPQRTLPANLAGAIADLPGVSATRAGQFAFGTVDGTKTLFEAVAPGSHAPAYVAASATARDGIDRGQGVVVSRQYALRHDVDIGDRTTLPTPDGTETVPVLDVVDSFAWELGLVLVPLELGERWFERPGPSWIEVDVEGRSVADVRAEVDVLLERTHVVAVLETGQESVDSALGTVASLTSVFVVMQWAVVGACSLVLLNATIAAATRRRREMAVLRAVGLTPRDAALIVLQETVSLALVGTALGTVTGLAVHWATLRAARALSGFGITYELVPAIAGQVGLTVLVLTAVGALLPTIRAAKSPIAAALDA